MSEQRKRQHQTQTNEDRDESYRKQGVGKAELCILETDEQRKSKRADNTFGMASQRSQESDLQREKRRGDNAAQKASTRSQKSHLQGEKRCADNAAQKALKWSQESDLQHEYRCADSALRMASLRSQESDVIQTGRLLLLRNMRLNETTHKRQRRLQNQERYNQNYNNQLPQFEASLFNFADILCKVCRKLCYKTQITSVDILSPSVVNLFTGIEGRIITYCYV